ncbi:AAA family ATPase [Promicromonospora sp. NPDC050262]|uniref:AAA family ATPase n=1 Tax=Promicromonospora sp. NPDC050262 TaxID=3155036 RepID=UPI0033D23545
MTTPAPLLRPVPDSPDTSDGARGRAPEPVPDRAADHSAGSAVDRPAASPAGPLMIVVGGVPGAGKSTLLANVAADVPRAVVLDPDRYRRRIAARLPSWVPYVAYRWVAHTLHAVATVLSLLAGPRSGRPLLVHDTATRERRRELLGLLARRCGWDPVLVAVDVSLAEALDGQLDRGRVVQPDEFVRHWERWTAQRSLLAAAAGGPRGPWSAVHLMERCDAFGQVRDLVRRRSVVVAARRPEPAPGGARAANPCAA